MTAGEVTSRRLEDQAALSDALVVGRLARYLIPSWRRMALAAVMILVYIGTIAAFPWAVKWSIDSYLVDRDLSKIDQGGAILVIIALVAFVSRYVHESQLAHIGQRLLFDLRVDLFGHIQRLELAFFDRNETGQVMSRVQNDVREIQEFISVLIRTLADLLSLGAVIVAMFLMSPSLTAITLSVIPVLICMLLLWQRYSRPAFLRVRDSIAGVNSRLQENITGIRVVQSLNREQANMEQFDEANTRNLSANLRAAQYSAFLHPNVRLLNAAAVALVVLFGGLMALEGSLEIGVIVAFALYVERMFQPVRSLTSAFGDLQLSLTAGARVFEILDMSPRVNESERPVSISRAKGEVCYEEVGFGYTASVPVLQGIDLRIRAGERIALVGPTGAGKTTMASLMLRLYDITKGRITIDGHDLRDVTSASLGRTMALVPQEPYLFSGSIADNIRFCAPNVSAEDVVRAARAVGAHDFIDRLERGYDTPLQERGTNLSVGQRQLISLARAISADPRILIMDEATANIDTYTEMVIQQGLEELLRGRTALIIAHRLSTIRDADRIVVLNEGRIVEQGRHGDLMSAGGLYNRLHSHFVET